MAVVVKILFFAKARELSGLKESELRVHSPVSYDTLLQQVVDNFSLQSIQQSLILAINEEYTDLTADINLKTGDQIAVIPPLSGGKHQFLVSLYCWMSLE